MTDTSKYANISLSLETYNKIKNQSEKLCEFIQHYTKTDCEVLIVEAGRGYAAKFGKCMSTLGFSPDVIFQEEWAGHPEKFKGKIHRFLRAKNKRH